MTDSLLEITASTEGIPLTSAVGAGPGYWLVAVFPALAEPSNLQRACALQGCWPCWSIRWLCPAAPDATVGSREVLCSFHPGMARSIKAIQPGLKVQHLL